MLINTSKTVCVFCGASGKMSQTHKSNAYALGMQLAENGYHLLTGGANVGMMKEVVDGHAAIKSTLIRHGVMPTIFKEFEIDHPLISENKMIWSQDVHQRIKTFYEICDDIIVMPGGFGTLHELMDCLVHSQFGLITKRIYLLNINGFWDHMLAQFKVMVDEHAVEQKHLDYIIVVRTIPELIASLKSELTVKLSQGIEAERWEVDN